MRKHANWERAEATGTLSTFPSTATHAFNQHAELGRFSCGGAPCGSALPLKAYMFSKPWSHFVAHTHRITRARLCCRNFPHCSLGQDRVGQQRVVAKPVARHCPERGPCHFAHPQQHREIREIVSVRIYLWHAAGSACTRAASEARTFSPCPPPEARSI